MTINNLQLSIYKLRKKLFCSLLAVVIASAALLIKGSPAKAQGVSLAISPPLTEITIQPGKTFNQTFTVRNDGAPVTVISRIYPFVPSDAKGHAEIIEDQTSIDATSSWFSFDQAPVNLGENESREITVKIMPPIEASEGDYYFTFLLTTENSETIGESNTQAQARVGVNLLMTISKDGNPIKNASTITFSSATFIDSFSPLTYKVVIKNLGGSFFKPTGKITVEQVFGSTTTLNLAPLNVLVGGSREISCIQDQDVIPCTLPGKFLIGLYRANLNFTLDNSDKSFERQTYTIAFPFTITLGLILIGISYRIIKRLTSL
jgi:hypothetical protein